MLRVSWNRANSNNANQIENLPNPTDMAMQDMRNSIGLPHDPRVLAPSSIDPAESSSSTSGLTLMQQSVSIPTLLQ